jgi:hypothetical protein
LDSDEGELGLGHDSDENNSNAEAYLRSTMRECAGLGNGVGTGCYLDLLQSILLLLGLF